MSKGYNGFSNWETWNFINWYSDYLQMELSDQELSGYDDVYRHVEDFIELLKEEIPAGSGFMQDVIYHGFSGLNLEQITRNIMDV